MPASQLGLPAISDDSGIEVDALGGEPGIYSARYAGSHGPAADKENNTKLLHELRDIPEAERTARFQCVITYMRHDKDPMPVNLPGHLGRPHSIRRRGCEWLWL